MLIRLLIRCFNLITLLLISLSVNAEEIGSTPTDLNKSALDNIDQFFLKNPKENNVIWVPKIEGKSRYAFSIHKDAYLISKKHTDASDLYYMSEQIDNGLSFHKEKSKNISIIISKNYSNLILRQRMLANINAGLFLINKEKKYFGLNLNKDIIISKNAFGNFSIEQANDGNTALNAKFVKLTDNEKSEFFGYINHDFKPDILNVGIGYTLFEIINQFDFTLNIQKQDKNVLSDLYVTFGEENMRFQIGLNQKNSNSNLNMFFNLKFENNVNMKKFGTNIIIASQDSIFKLRNLSLKSFRKKNLDMLWKKNINYK